MRTTKSTKKRRKPAAKPKLYQPDWGLCATCSGGKLAEIPQPHVRFYRDSPTKRKRIVRIEATSFCEVGSIGAKHLYVEIQEDFDRVWNSIEQHWQRCGDDAAGEGRQITDRRQFLYGKDEAVAARWVKEQLAKHFPPATHTYEFNYGGLSRKLKRAVGRINRAGD